MLDRTRARHWRSDPTDFVGTWKGSPGSLHQRSGVFIEQAAASVAAITTTRAVGRMDLMVASCVALR